jgi:hypothetical protein
MADLYGIDNLPYGVFSVGGAPARVGVRFGDAVLDLHAATGRDEFARPSLNASSPSAETPGAAPAARWSTSWAGRRR